MSLNVLKEILERPNCARGSAWSLLVSMANRAADDGTGIWAKMETLAAGCGVDVKTVRRSLRSLLASGVVIDTGEIHKTWRGYTKVYRIDLAKLRTLQDWNEWRSKRPLVNLTTGQSDQHSKTSGGQFVPGVVVNLGVEPVQVTSPKTEREWEGGDTPGPVTEETILDAEVVEETPAPSVPVQPKLPFPVRAARHLWKTCIHIPRFKGDVDTRWTPRMEALEKELGEEKLKGILRYLAGDEGGFFVDLLVKSKDPMDTLAKWIHEDNPNGLKDKYERSLLARPVREKKKEKKPNAGKPGNYTSAIERKLQLIDHNRSILSAAAAYLDQEAAAQEAGGPLPVPQPAGD